MRYTLSTTRLSYRCAYAYNSRTFPSLSLNRTYSQLPRTTVPTQLRPVPLRMTGLTLQQGRTSTSTMPLIRRDMSSKPETLRKAYIALGSNVGDRLDMIEKACLALDQDPDIKVTRTSSLYETEPMYVEDQARFLNGACEVGNFYDRLWNSRLIFGDRYKPHSNL
jgi:hypothetical protein